MYEPNVERIIEDWVQQIKPVTYVSITNTARHQSEIITEGIVYFEDGNGKEFSLKISVDIEED